ncbi:hypothetical protein MASR2M64_12930 [Candidatus Cloacimonadota bacterium]
MEIKEDTGIKTVPHKERPASLEVKIAEIPKWKQDVFNLVAELTKYRLRNKITQQKLADRLQVKQSVIARFEKLGRYPTVEFLYKIADGLGMQLDISVRPVEVATVSEAAKGEKAEVSLFSCYNQILENCKPLIPLGKPKSIVSEDWGKWSIPGKVFFTAKDARLETAFIQDVEAIIRQISAFTSSDKSGDIPIYNVSATPENSFKEQPQESEISNPAIDLAA